MYREKILLVDDEESLLGLARLALEKKGYDVSCATDGQEALEKVRKELPDLVITDVEMPLMDGNELCRAIRQDILLTGLPVIMLTSKREEKDQLKGLAHGADDYILKPYSEYMLLARVEMVLRRTKTNLDANPLTRLPGNKALSQKIEEYIKSGRPFAACYADLNNFKAYNDCYGYIKGDEVIRETARILVRAINGNTSAAFIGHIGGDDFILLSLVEEIEPLSKRIITDFDSEIKRFYEKEDCNRGYFISRDRKGLEMKFPLLGLALAVTTTENCRYRHPGEINAVLAELKKLAKAEKKSTYVLDRRKDPAA